MKRTVRKICITVFALALAGGTALAQDDDDMGGDDMGGDDMGGDDMGGDDMGGGDMGGDTGSTDAPPPPDSGAEGSATAGKIKAGAKVMIPKGLDEDLEFALGAYIEVTPWANYQVNDKISAGVALPLLLVKPEGIDALQAVIAHADYAVNEKLTANVMAGMGRPARLGFNPWGGGGLPASAGDMKIGFGVGGTYNHKMDKINISAGAKLVMQLDSDADDMGEQKALLVVHVPLMAMYAVNEKMQAGVATGVYTGGDVSFKAEEGFTLPLVVGAKYMVNEQIAAGAFLGASNLTPPDGIGVGDTLTLGGFVGYSM